ncbi:MAG: hypothetical protein QNJ46_33855 [Leptolyngbyaceae cyanobacterium MO_188.B28]|nr:hypothetical protein [Leptolyngbyaceae cyanobacterium MO_188.B28]
MLTSRPSMNSTTANQIAALFSAHPPGTTDWRSLFEEQPHH